MRQAHLPSETIVYPTREQAVRAARDLLRTEGGTLVVRAPNGRTTETVTVGRRAIAKINAVEGLCLTDDMQREFREFDRRKLTDEERRAAIIAKYGAGSR